MGFWVFSESDDESEVEKYLDFLSDNQSHLGFSNLIFRVEGDLMKPRFELMDLNSGFWIGCLKFSIK